MTVARMENVGDVVRYENAYRPCYNRGPERTLIGLAQDIGQQTSLRATQ